MAKIDITGQKFGKLTVIRESGRHKDGNVLWECECSCGNTSVLSGISLRKKLTQSCGCLRKESATRHGLRNSPEYNNWKAMNERCHNPNNISYANYGARGIEVCEEWRHSFENFYADMGAKPSPGHTIDRKEVNDGYNPSNCKWSTMTEQSRNRRIQCNNTTGYPGVGLHLGKYRARIGVNGKNITLGEFKTLDEAIFARKEAEKDMW